MTTTADLTHEPDTGCPTLRDLDRVGGAGRGGLGASHRGPRGGPAAGAAVHWVDLHPVTDAAPGRGVPGRTRRGPAGPRAGVLPTRSRWPGTAPRASREYAVEELAAALDLSLPGRAARWSARRSSSASGCPRLWALVQDGRLQAWKARQVAQRHHRPVAGRRWRSWTGTWRSPAGTTGSRR